MAKMKRILAMALVLVLVICLSVAGTVAYLQYSSGDVNTMTVGNVKIDQIEQERKDDGTMGEFTDDKKLTPVTGDTGSYTDEIVTNNGLTGEDAKEYKTEVLSNDINALDKLVTIENTGTEDAYVRTLFAFEMLKKTDDQGNVTWENPVGTMLMTVANEGMVEGEDIVFPKTNGKNVTIELDGVKYVVGEYYYKNGSKLTADEISHPSLAQIYLNSTVGNEWFEGVGEQYDILVLSQAVQTQGFADAKTALDTAFGELSAAKALEWFSDEAVFGA